MRLSDAEIEALYEKMDNFEKLEEWREALGEEMFTTIVVEELFQTELVKIDKLIKDLEDKMIDKMYDNLRKQYQDIDN